LPAFREYVLLLDADIEFVHSQRLQRDVCNFILLLLFPGFE
jgi:hypothetical protein